jgi:hypothetical protein
MTKISVMYPNSKDIKLNMVYSKNKHIALLSNTFGTDDLKGLELDLGIAVTPSDSASYNTITKVLFKDIEFFKISF